MPARVGPTPPRDQGPMEVTVKRSGGRRLTYQLTLQVGRGGVGGQGGQGVCVE